MLGITIIQINTHNEHLVVQEQTVFSEHTVDEGRVKCWEPPRAKPRWRPHCTPQCCWGATGASAPPPFPGHTPAQALDLATCLHSQPQGLQALHMPQTGQPAQLLVYAGETSHKSDLFLLLLSVPHSTAISQRCALALSSYTPCGYKPKQNHEPQYINKSLSSTQ